MSWMRPGTEFSQFLRIFLAFFYAKSIQFKYKHSSETPNTRNCNWQGWAGVSRKNLRNWLNSAPYLIQGLSWVKGQHKIRHYQRHQQGHQGPVVQSIVSLTSSLSGQLVKFLWLYIQIHWNFFVEIMRKAFALQKLFTFFSTKNIGIFWDINIWNFNISLTNDVVSFEQPGPG